MLSDLFIVSPLVILSFGIIVWRRRRIARKLRTKNVVDSHMRHYCTACGVYVDPGAKVCESCGTSLSKSRTDSYCTACGRPLPDIAKYCAYCGEEVMKGGSVACASCGGPTSASARYCHNCGVRLGSAKQDRLKPAW